MSYRWVHCSRYIFLFLNVAYLFGAEQNVDPMPLLQGAIKCGNAIMVYHLLDKYPHYYFRDRNEPFLQKELLSAIKGKNIAIAELLLDYGADPIVYSQEDRDNYQNKKKVRLPYWRDCQYETPLTLACENKLSSVVARLLQKGCYVEASDTVHTPLEYALYNGDERSVRMLLRYGALVKKVDCDEDEWTPLQIAAQDDNVSIVRMLLERGANITTRNPDGWPVLHIASQYDHPDVIHLLLQYGADVNELNEKNYSALSIALAKGKCDTACVLITYGATLQGSPLRFKTVRAMQRVRAMSSMLWAEKEKRNRLLRTFFASNVGSTSDTVETLFIQLCDGSATFLPVDCNITADDETGKKWEVAHGAIYAAYKKVLEDHCPYLGSDLPRLILDFSG